MARVVIIGAGIFGVTAAVELRRRGHAVQLVDPGPLPHPRASSTDVSKAVRMDYGADTLYVELMERCFDGWRDWNRSWNETVYHEDGFLVITSAAMAEGTFEQESHRCLTGRGHPLERLAGAALQERFPVWAPGVYRDGYLNPRGGWAESGRVVELLLREARALGVDLRDNTAVSRLDEKDGRVGGVVTAEGETLSADVVVAAAGTWTPHLLPHLQKLMWTVGQPVIHFQPEDPDLFRAPAFCGWAADIARSGWYGFPALPDGRVKVANHGPGLDLDPDRDHTVSPEMEARFRAFLRTALPALAEAPAVFHRVCLYCDTWDGDFYITPDPARPGLVLATGGSGHAFKFAPLLGPLIADAVEERANPWLPRFAWRDRRGRRHEAARQLE